VATITKQIGGFDNGPGDTVRFEYDYDDVTLRLILLRASDDAAQNARVWIQRTSDGLLVDQVVVPGQTATRTLPTTGPNRVFVTIDARGRSSITGWIGGCEYPSSV
jgi:hypothetical protein